MLPELALIRGERVIAEAREDDARGFAVLARERGDFTVLWHNDWLVTARQRRLLRLALGS